MSAAALGWAWDQQCPNGVSKAVLTYLAYCSDQDDGGCSPSLARICERTQHGALAVRKAIRLLCECGLLQVAPQILGNGRQTSNLYRLVAPTPAISQEAVDLAPAISQASIDSATLPEPQGYDLEEPIGKQGHLTLGPVVLTPAKSQATVDLAPAKQQEILYVHKKVSKKVQDRLLCDSGSCSTQCPPLPKTEPAGFSDWYQIYPRKVGRSDASKAYVKARKIATVEEIMAGLKSYPFNTDPQYQPLPTTWLNKCRWQHEASIPPPATNEVDDYNAKVARLLRQKAF